MPLCGFNNKMLNGLNDFNEGLVEHGLFYKTVITQESLTRGIRKEISGLARLQTEIHRIEDAPKRIVTQGLVTYVTGFYLIMKQNELPDDPQLYKEFISNINTYFKKMDDKYYGELEGKSDDMKRLVKYLNKMRV